MKKLTIVLVLVAILMSACGPKEVVIVERIPVVEECTQSEYIEATQNLEGQWNDALALANNSSRMSLSGPLSEIQAILREFKRLELAECYQGAHTIRVHSHELVVEGFLSFLGGEDDRNEIRLFFTKSSLEFDKFLDELHKLPLGNS